MAQEISVILSLQTAQAIEKLNTFLGRAAHGLKDLVSEVAAAYVGIRGLEKVFDSLKEAISIEEEVGRLNERTGLSISLIAALKEQANAVKVPFDDLATSLGKFSKNVYDAFQNGSAVFEQLRVTVTDADGKLRSTDDILEDVAQRFKEMPAGPEKAAMAMELFGRSGRQLIPVLNAGADGIRQMRDAGSPITDEGVEKATEFNRQMREIHEAIEMIFVQVANNLLPVLVAIADRMKEAARDTDNAGSAVVGLTDIFKGLLTILIVVVRAFKDLGIYIGVGLQLAWEVMIAKEQLVERVLNNLILAIATVVDALINLAVTSTRTFDVMALAASGHLVDAFNEAKDIAKDGSEEIKRIIGAFPKAIADSGKDALQTFQAQWDNVSKQVKDNLLDIGFGWMKVQQMISDMWDGAHGKTAPGEHATKSEGDGAGGITNSAVKRLSQWAAIMNDTFKLNQKIIENNPFASQVEKAEKLLPMIREQKALVEAEIGKANSQLSGAKTEDQRIEATKTLLKLKGELADLDTKQTQLESLTSFKDQFSMAQTELQNSWGSWAQQTASAFKTVFTTAISSISSGITGLIMGTMTWGQALRQIGSTILTTIVQSIVQMGVQWVMTHVIMRGAMALTHAIGRALGWAGVAETNAQEAAKAPALAANAATASVGSYGAAAVVGMVLAVAAIGAIIALATARERGGPVTAGMPYIVGERKPELFVPGVSGTILPSVPSLQAFSSGAYSSSTSDAPGGTTLNAMFHIVDSAEAAMDKMRKNPDAEHWVVDMVNKNVHRIRVRPA